MPKFPNLPDNSIPQAALDKLKALVLYIVSNCDGNDLGAVKLNKVLWYADVVWYLKNGVPITGGRYVKREHGPMSQQFYDVIAMLEDEGALQKRESEYFGFKKTEYISLREADISTFKPEQIGLVHTIIDHVCRKHTARSVSEETHDVIWQLADIGEEIPLHAVWAANLDEITEEDIKWANEKLTAKYGR